MIDSEAGAEPGAGPVQNPDLKGGALVRTNQRLPYGRGSALELYATAGMGKD